MRTLFSVTFVFTIVAAVHCGGRVDGDPDGGSCNPTDSCSTEGATCTITTASECQQPSQTTCTCENGMWACPLPADCEIACPIDTYPGSSCTQKGLQCEAMVKPQCVDVPIMCTCDGQQFQCPIPDCPTNLCPPSDQVVSGDPCSVPGNELCAGSLGAQCTCTGTWQCEDPVDAGPPPDAGVSD